MWLTIEIVVFVLLALLGLDLFRYSVRKMFPGVKEIYLDGTYLLLVAIGAYLLFPKAMQEETLRRSLKQTEEALETTKKELDNTKKESLETKLLLDGTRNDLKAEKEKREKATADLLKTQDDLITAQKELTDVNRRESLRRWAMLLPSGEEANDAMGLDTKSGGQRTKDFSKVFQPTKGGGLSFAGPKRCESKTYLDDIRYLMTHYDKSPYPRVALAFCLKHLGDSNWKKEAARAKADLEFYMSIEPHVLTIDAFYGFVMKDILDNKTKLEDTGFFIRRGDNSYRPKNMPP
jgi:hypothetical protein